MALTGIGSEAGEYRSFRPDHEDWERQDMSELFDKIFKSKRKDKGIKKAVGPTTSVAALGATVPDNAPVASTSKTSRTASSSSTSGAKKTPGRRKQECLEWGVTALKFLKEISEGSELLSPLKAACGATTAILETIQVMDNNSEGWKGILETVRRHHQTFEEQLRLVNADNVTADANSALLSPIKAYARELEGLLKELMRENGISDDNIPTESKFQSLKSFMLRYGTVKLEADRISDYIARLDEAMKRFNVAMLTSLGIEVGNISRNMDQIKAHLLHPPEFIADVEIILKPRPSLAQNFVGREDILEKMRQTHITGHSPKLNTPAITVLYGLGGSGKTQIALKFILEVEKLDPVVPVFFLNADSEKSLKEDYESLIRSLGKEHRSKSHKDALTWLATKLKNWLLILDNADDPDFRLFPYIPKSPLGNVIITTRNANHPTGARDNRHAIDGLSEPDSIALILESSGYESTKENQAIVAQIVRELGNLPLALAQAAGYIFINQCLSTYLNIYRESTVKVLASSSLQQLDDYPLSVALAIQTSLDHLPQAIQDLLRLFAHLDSASIARSIIVKAAERRFEHVTGTEGSELNTETLEHAKALRAIFFKDGEWSDFEFNELITQCLQYSLLQIRTRGEENFYSMHVLVRSYLKASSTLIQSHQPCQLAVRLLGSSITISDNYEFLAFNRLLLPHIRLIRLEDVVEAGDYFGFGRVFSETGDWKSAVTHQERCVDMWRASLGDEHNSTLGAMMELAISYRDLERNQEALELDERLVGLTRKLFGPEASETLNAMHNLAGSYRHVGRRKEAMEMEEQLLEMKKRILGPENPSTLSTMNNLAKSYKGLGRNQNALKLWEQGLEISSRVLGPEHPDTLMSMSNLAVSYSDVGRETKALKLKEQVLELRTKVLGLEHPDTVSAMRNLTNSLRKLGLKERLLELLWTAVPLYERIWGPDDKKTISARKEVTELSKELEGRNP